MRLEQRSRKLSLYLWAVPILCPVSPLWTLALSSAITVPHLDHLHALTALDKTVEIARQLHNFLSNPPSLQFLS